VGADRKPCREPRLLQGHDEFSVTDVAGDQSCPGNLAKKRRL